MEQAIDNRLAEACQKSAAATLGFVPKHHEQYTDGPLAGAWYQRLWTQHVDQRELWAEKKAIEDGGGLVIAVGRSV